MECMFLFYQKKKWEKSETGHPFVPKNVISIKVGKYHHPIIIVIYLLFVFWVIVFPAKEEANGRCRLFLFGLLYHLHDYN